MRALAAGRAQVRVDLAGDVTLQAADDLGLGLSFFGAAFDVGAGGRVMFGPGYRWVADKTGMGRSRWSASSY